MHFAGVAVQSQLDARLQPHQFDPAAVVLEEPQRPGPLARSFGYPWRIGRQRVGGGEGVSWVDHALAPVGQSPYDGRGRGTAKDPLWAQDVEPLFELDMRLPPPQSRQLVRFLHGELRAAIVDGRLKPRLRLPSST